MMVHSRIKVYLRMVAGLAVLLGLILIVLSAELFFHNPTTVDLYHLDSLFAVFLLIIGIRLLFFARQAWNHKNPQTIRDSTGLLAFVGFVYLSQLIDKHPELKPSPDNDNQLWALLIIIIALFVTHRSVSYWMIKALPDSASVGK